MNNIEKIIVGIILGHTIQGFVYSEAAAINDLLSKLAGN